MIGYITPTRGELKEDGSHSKDYIRRQIPPIGKRLRKRITGKSDQDDRGPQWGEVIYVNYEHLFYRVRFSGCGITESYKAI